MKLYLDDLRLTPDGWTRAYTAEEAIAFLKTGEVTEASLDHDLGCYPGTLIDLPSGATVTDWMAENNVWPPDGVSVHSANPVAVRTMRATIDRYGPYGT